MKKLVIIIIPIVVVVLIGAIVIFSQNSVKLTAMSGDTELKVMQNGEIYCTKFDAYLLDFNNKRIKVRELLTCDSNVCYIVDKKSNVYKYDLDGSFYTKSMFENQKYFMLTSDSYSGKVRIMLQNIGGGYEDTSIMENIIKRYDMLSSTEYDLVNDTDKKF